MTERGHEEVIHACGQFVKIFGVVLIRVAGFAQPGGKRPQLHLTPAIHHQPVAVILCQRDDLCIRWEGFAYFTPKRGFMMKIFRDEDGTRGVGLISDDGDRQGDETYASNPANA